MIPDSAAGWNALGDVLPLAAGIAVSPLKIVALMLLLTAPGGRAKGVAFAFGALAGMILAAFAIAALAGAPTGGEGETSKVQYAVKLVVGLLLWAGAAWRWRKRDDPAAQHRPKWMDKLVGLGPAQAFGLGAVLMSVNLKNLPILVSATLSIAGADLTAAQERRALVGFCIAACIALLIPALAALLLGKRADAGLKSAGDWLAANNGAILIGLLVVLGAKLVGGGVSGLFGG